MPLTQRIRGLRAPTRAEKYVASAVAAVALFAVGASFVVSWDVARRKEALLEAVAEERAVLPERARVLVGAMDDVLLEAAAVPYPGDYVAPDLAAKVARVAVLERPLPYVRAAQPEIARLDALAGAVRRSEKDAFVLCLRRPPASDAPPDVRAAATRFWINGALFEDATHDVLPLAAVHAGLRPLSRSFADEVANADGHLWVRRLEDEYVQRTPNALSLARTAAGADALVAVVDELPEGMAAPDVGRSLTATRRPAVLPQVEDRPHFVRIVVWGANARAPLVRIRTHVDVTRLGLAPADAAMSAAHVHACQAAVALLNGPAAPR